MNWIKALLTACLSLALVACGGGGSDAGTSPFGSGSGGGTSPTAPTTAPKLTLALSSVTVTSAAPVTVTATVVDSTGTPVANQVVTFSTVAGYGVLNAPTALTNSSGVAAVTLSPAASTTVGADTVTASVTINGVAATASAGFQLTATDVTISSFTSDVGAGALTAYGQTTLTVGVTGAAAGASVKVSMTSACVTAGKATLSPATATTTSGTATFIYKDTGGCGSTLATDNLQATIAGGSSGKSLALGLTSPSASSISFVSASPETIYLKSSGYIATALVTFKVVDLSNNALPGQSVSMVATTYTGGLTLDGVSAPVTKTSDSNGLVTVLVNSGTVPTPVRVVATLAKPLVTTSSSNLSIAVGLPTQSAFSLSQKTINIEGFDVDGTQNTYTLIASDRMGNPVPAGTSINFVSEGGQIVGVGQIALSASGLASTTVSFQSASPRPANGRITVVAYALGEESFIDANGNNVYDAGEAFQDLGDVFVSRPFTSVYDEANDQRIPQTLSSPAACVNSSSPLLALDRSSPSAATFGGANRCDGVWGQAFVRRATETVLSTSGARPLWLNVGPGASVKLDSGCKLVTVTGDAGTPVSGYAVGFGNLYGLSGAGGSLSFLVADANGVRLNPMAAGTTVSAGSSSNMTVSVLGGSPVPNSATATAAAVSYAFTTGTSGTITLSFTSPGGLTTTFPLSVTTSPAPPSGAACP